MEIVEKNAVFLKDEEGIIILTDIEYSSKIVRGEIVYDGKNAIILNRNNKHYYCLKNIPPYIRKELIEADNVTIIEKRSEDDIYSYSLKVRMVDDLDIPDEWKEFSESVVKALEENLNETELKEFLKQAETIYKKMAS